MITLQTHLFKEAEIPYDGTPLAPHWIYRKFNLLGDALVAFVGPAKVDLDHMVDLEDVKQNAPIYSPKMLHFLGEWFIDSLETGILLQHLLWEMFINDFGNGAVETSQERETTFSTINEK